VTCVDPCVQEVCSTYESSPQFSELLSEIQAAEDLAESNEILVRTDDGDDFLSDSHVTVAHCQQC